MTLRREVIRKSGFDRRSNFKHLLASGSEDVGQSYLQRYPYRGADGAPLTEALGDPLSIRNVAELIGCSAWTVRQRYLPAGLPHHRLTPNGKLIFYRNQVIRWLIARQQKGGIVP